MSIGEKIIAAINERDLAHGLEGETPFWMPSAAEQLEAVVEAHIEERVRVRLELDRQRDQEAIQRIIFLGDDLCRTLQEESRFIDKTASQIFDNPPPIHMMTSKMRSDAWGAATCGLRKKPDVFPAD
jgi:hypothetical protein